MVADGWGQGQASDLLQRHGLAGPPAYRQAAAVHLNRMGQIGCICKRWVHRMQRVHRIVPVSLAGWL